MKDEQLKKGDFSSDSPVNIPEKDAFHRYPFAVRIAELIQSRSDPSSTVIGIYGAWGEGKTTVLEFVKGKLKEKANVHLMPFNPWRFGTDEQLLWTFFTSLSEILKRPLKTKGETLASWIVEYGELVIPPIEIGWGAAKVSPGEAAAKIAKRFSGVNLEKVRGRIEDALTNVGERVVVIMDDIDRLDSDEIHQVFKLIKLTANFPYVDYLLAFDDNVVADALSKRYGSSGPETGHGFLEKIVQIPLSLPVASEASLQRFLFLAVDSLLRDIGIELAEEQARTFASQFNDCLQQFIKTPRMAWRYANALRFSLPVVKNEIDVVDFMLLEATHLFFPVVYEIIKSTGLELLQRQKLGINEKDLLIEKINEVLEALPKDEKNSAIDLLRFLLPQLQSVIGRGGLFGKMSYGADSYDSWGKVRRLCVIEYFPRYFTLAVSSDDISDVAVTSLISAAKQGGDTVVKWLDKNGKRELAEILIQKIWRRIDELDESAAAALCVGFAKKGQLFSDASEMMSLSTSVNAARLIWRIITTCLPPNSRRLLARRVIAESCPSYFSSDCLWMFRPSKKENDSGILSDRESKQCSSEIARRSLAEFENVVPWDSYPNSFVQTLLLCARELGKKSTERCLFRIFDKNPATIFDFLLHFTGKSYPLQTGIPHPQDFEQRHLETLEVICPPKRIFLLVRKQAGKRLDLKNYYDADKFDGGEKVAAQFLSVYKQQTAKAEQSSLESAG